ncbi:MAG: biopolymer transporter ExbD [Ignavibacteriales bacterium CG_4_9_14_3_um_filter_30_11]|nr:MAG: biopolymer transporter ExbD [Ignavibacteriales bacterium CG_4_9_14_3_um_filter_30_11]
MKFDIENKPLTSFNFSSLTDIVLLLVIFFLLTSQFVVNTGVKVNLPGSKTNDPIAQSDFAITITSTGEIFVNNKKVDEKNLTSELLLLKNNLKKDNLIIRSDKDVVIDKLIKVIDAAKAANILKFTIETEKKIE